MFVDYIELENIRSYTKARIEFPPGITVFRGDIGAGKSTILQAIEFALFGADHIHYEHLLREGTNEGRIVLGFTHKGQKYVIERLIIKRASGPKQRIWITVNDTTRNEYTSREAKSIILKILNIQEGERSGSKKIIRSYRYALYVPQEEMKDILSTLKVDREERINLLRRLFGIETYKIAKDNAKYLVNEIKRDIKELKEKIARIDDLKNEVETIKADLVNHNRELNDLTTQFETMNINKNNVRAKIRKVEAEVEEINKIKEKLSEFKAKLQAKVEELNNKKMELEECKKAAAERKNLQPKVDRYSQLEKELRELERQKERYNKLISTVEKFEIRAEMLRKDIEDAEREIGEMDTLLAKINTLKKEVSDLEKVENNIHEIENKISVGEGEIKALNGKIRELQGEIDELMSLKGTKVCPKCRQMIDEGHLKRIVDDTKIKIEMIRNEIEMKTKKVKKLKDNIQELRKRAEGLRKKEHEITELTTKLNGLEKMKVEIEKKKEELNEINKKINDLRNEISKIEYKEDELQAKKNEINELKGQWEHYISLEQMANKVDSVNAYIKKLESEVNTLKKRIENLNSMLKERNELELQHEKNKLLKEQESIEEELQNLNRKIGKLNGIIQEKKINLKSKEQDLKNLEEEKKRCDKLEYIVRWLDTGFAVAMDLIEKNVMYSIRAEFNELFQKFFNMILEDSEFMLEIDDDFCPRITVEGGYERNIEALSGGERTSISLAYRLALNSVLKDLYFSAQDNILILDEPTDGFSKEQIERMKDLLRQMECSQIIIVSHEVEVEALANNIYHVQKTPQGTKISLVR